MTHPFDYFVIIAEMRTGSNFLETNVNLFSEIKCFGEAFNPNFIGHPNTNEILGITQAMRDADPLRLIKTIKELPKGLGGFRYFHDHDPRALEIFLDDPRCAKIILTRNPLESYISWKIARATGQWKLTNVKQQRDSRVSFDAAEFEQYTTELQAFQIKLLNRLQISGQTAFYLAYEDLLDVEVINGLARFLGVSERLDALDSSIKKQNPKPMQSKVSNYDDMEEALSGQDPFNLTRTPSFEPRRGAAVPSYLAGVKAPLLYLPVKGGPEAEIRDWLAGLDGEHSAALQPMPTQKALRQWKRQNGQHRSFTVIRHPVARAHAVFSSSILPVGIEQFAHIRKVLRNAYKLPLPAKGPDAGYDRRAHRQAFVAFLEFLRANLAGQTNLRVDAHWASQANVIQGMAQFALPDVIIREDEMTAHMPWLARQIGYDKSAPPADAPADTPVSLANIYDDEIEDLVKNIYQRDYMIFGFRAWG